MATTTGKTRCIICEKEKATSKCSGCLEDFCFNHLVEHRQQMTKELDELEDKRNLFRQTLTEQIKNLQKHSLIQQINQWKKDSINKIRTTAEEAKELLLKYTTEHIDEIEIKLTKLTEELKQIREENDFNEIDLNELKEKLKQLEDKLNKPSNISIREDSSSFIKKISVIISSGKYFMNIN
jgi:DNA repair exonuclease SbcCD ATPase subunit